MKKTIKIFTFLFLIYFNIFAFSQSNFRQSMLSLPNEMKFKILEKLTLHDLNKIFHAEDDMKEPIIGYLNSFKKLEINGNIDNIKSIIELYNKGKKYSRFLSLGENIQSIVLDFTSLTVNSTQNESDLDSLIHDIINTILVHFPQLNKLEIFLNRENIFNIYHFEKIAKITSLKSLVITQLSEAVPIEIIKELKELETLEITGGLFTANGINELLFKDLRKLSIAKSQLDANCLISIINNFKKLEYLLIDENFTIEENQLSQLKNTNNLNFLSLNINNHEPIKASFLKHLPNLEKLYFECEKISEEFFVNLSSCNNIESLHIFSSTYSISSYDLFKLKNLTKIINLSLFNIKYSDECIYLISQQFKRVKYLYLSNETYDNQTEVKMTQNGFLNLLKLTQLERVGILNIKIDDITLNEVDDKSLENFFENLEYFDIILDTNEHKTSHLLNIISKHNNAVHIRIGVNYLKCEEIKNLSNNKNLKYLEAYNVNSNDFNNLQLIKFKNNLLFLAINNLILIDNYQ